MGDRAGVGRSLHVDAFARSRDAPYSRAVSEADRRTPLEKALSVVTEVKAGEGVSALLMTLNIFLLLNAYYLIKPVREALIGASGDQGAEYKAYMAGAIAIALLGAVPAYAKFAGSVKRNRLVIGATLFFASHLVGFWVLSFFRDSDPRFTLWLALGFYLWVGIFNMMVVAQFWAFAADIYTEGAGKRLFPLIGIGASVGASLGAGISRLLFGVLGPYPMLLVAAAVLSSCALITQLVYKREGEEQDAKEAAAPAQEKPPTGSGAFALVFKHRYLLLLAAFSLLFTTVNSNGEFIMGKMVNADAFAQVPAGSLASEAAVSDARGTIIGTFWSTFFFWVNVLGFLLQTFAVSRLVKHLGIKIAFFIFPVIALLGGIAFLVAPVLLVLRIGKTAENATDYSLNNTLRGMLWLPTTREMKYKAKQAVDAFFVRMGDVSSALLVFVFSGLLGIVDLRIMAAANVVLIAVWIGLAVGIVRENAKLSAEKEAAEATEA